MQITQLITSQRITSIFETADDGWNMLIRLQINDDFWKVIMYCGRELGKFFQRSYTVISNDLMSSTNSLSQFNIIGTLNRKIRNSTKLYSNIMTIIATTEFRQIACNDHRLSYRAGDDLKIPWLHGLPVNHSL